MWLLNVTPKWTGIGLPEQSIGLSEHFSHKLIKNLFIVLTSASTMPSGNSKWICACSFNSACEARYSCPSLCCLLLAFKFSKYKNSLFCCYWASLICLVCRLVCTHDHESLRHDLVVYGSARENNYDRTSIKDGLLRYYWQLVMCDISNSS